MNIDQLLPLLLLSFVLHERRLPRDEVRDARLLADGVAHVDALRQKGVVLGIVR